MKSYSYPQFKSQDTENLQLQFTYYEKPFGIFGLILTFKIYWWFFYLKKKLFHESGEV